MHILLFRLFYIIASVTVCSINTQYSIKLTTASLTGALSN